MQPSAKMEPGEALKRPPAKMFRIRPLLPLGLATSLSGEQCVMVRSSDHNS